VIARVKVIGAHINGHHAATAILDPLSGVLF